MINMPSKRDPRPLSNLIVADDRWQGDQEPNWVECRGTRWQRPSKTAAEAEELRTKLVKRLRRFGNGDLDALELIDQLGECAASTPCGSGACPFCSRSHQRWFVNSCSGLTNNMRRPAAVSLTPDFGACDWGDIGELDLAAIKRKAARALVAANVKMALGGVDFSLNTGIDCTPHLQVHFYLFCLLLEPKQKTALRISFNTSGNIEVPILSTPFDGDNTALAYALKYDFFKRENYMQAAHQRTDNRISMNTRSRPLRGRAAMQLSIVLDRIGLDKRLILIGVKRIQKEGKVILIQA